MAGTRRIVTRSVSATQHQASSSAQDQQEYTTGTATQTHAKEQSQQLYTQPLLELPSQPSSTSCELSGEDRIEDGEGKKLRETRTPSPPAAVELSKPETIDPPPTSAAAQPKPAMRTHPKKRSRSPEEDRSDGNQPRKRQAVEPPNVTASVTPVARLNLASSKFDPLIPRSISLPDRMPLVFTPVGGRPVPKTGKRRLSNETQYQDIVVPLKDDDEATTTPLRSPEPPMRTAQFTFNPFVGRGVADEDSRPPHATSMEKPGTTSGDVYGPAVPSLDGMLSGEIPQQPQVETAMEAPITTFLQEPSPSRAVIPPKIKPSMIPRLALAPPPPPKPQQSKTIKYPSPTKSSFTKFFASPAKGSVQATPARPHTALGRTQPPKFASGRGVQASGKKPFAKAGSSTRQGTTLSVEAQASLANLSHALEKLSKPRPSTSLNSSTSSLDPDGPTLVEKTLEDDDIQARLDDLPPRPSTSLGVRSEHESRNGDSSTKRFGRLSRAPSLGRRTGTLGAQNATFLDPNDVLGPSSSKGKEKERAPPMIFGGEMMRESDCLVGCVIYVDVRTDEGSDASAMFVEMLKNLGAKVCFHQVQFPVQI